MVQDLAKPGTLIQRGIGDQFLCRHCRSNSRGSELETALLTGRRKNYASLYPGGFGITQLKNEPLERGSLTYREQHLMKLCRG